MTTLKSVDNARKGRSHVSDVVLDRAGQFRPARVAVGAVAFDPITLGEAVTRVRDAWVRGDGGRLVVVDTELHRHASRVGEDATALRRVVTEADLVLAGSVPAAWASRLAGSRVPERVSSRALGDVLAAACAVDRRRIFLIGGAVGGFGVPSGAQRTAAVLGLRLRDLRIAGHASPGADFDTDATRRSAVVAAAIEAKPDMIIVSAPPARQEQTIEALRASLPQTWIFECPGYVEEVQPTARITRPGPLGQLKAALVATLRSVLGSVMRPVRSRVWPHRWSGDWPRLAAVSPRRVVARLSHGAVLLVWASRSRSVRWWRGRAQFWGGAMTCGSPRSGGPGSSEDWPR